MKALRLAVLALACTTPLLAAAQWVYLDKSGRKVFSDQVPPPDIKPERILRQPGMKRDATLTDTAAAPAAAAAPAPKAGTDKTLEAKKKSADDAAAGKKRADEEKVAQMRADNCSRARASKSDFESGARILRTNAQGEREVMDDKQRDAEMKRINEVIASDCAK